MVGLAKELNVAGTVKRTTKDDSNVGFLSLINRRIVYEPGRERLGGGLSTEVNARKEKNSYPGLLESRFIEDQVLFLPLDKQRKLYTCDKVLCGLPRKLPVS